MKKLLLILVTIISNYGYPVVIEPITLKSKVTTIEKTLITLQGKVIKIEKNLVTLQKEKHKITVPRNSIHKQKIKIGDSVQAIFDLEEFKDLIRKNKKKLGKK